MGYCGKHYQRLRVNGSPHKTKIFTSEDTAKDRLRSKSLKVGTCIEWQGYIDRWGYGVMKFGNKDWLSHRLSFTVNVKPIPEGLHVLHKCDNPKCINPKHLFLGTHQDNMADKMSKGREARNFGEKGNPKLTNDKVLKIRSLYKNGNSQRSLAKKFCVSQSTISRLVTKTSWPNI